MALRSPLAHYGPCTVQYNHKAPLHTRPHCTQSAGLLPQARPEDSLARKTASLAGQKLEGSTGGRGWPVQSEGAPTTPSRGAIGGSHPINHNPLKISSRAARASSNALGPSSLGATWGDRGAIVRSRVSPEGATAACGRPHCGATGAQVAAWPLARWPLACWPLAGPKCSQVGTWKTVCGGPVHAGQKWD